MAGTVPLHVEELGRGPPVVLVHGWSLSSRALGVLGEALAPRFRVLLADLRGHGRSPAPRGGWAPEEHAADLVALLDRLGLDRAALVGWSFGASVVLAALPALGDRVSGAALLSATPRLCRGEEWAHGLRPEEARDLATRLRERPTPALRRWFGGMFAEGEIEEPPMVAMAQHMLDGAPPDPEGAARSLEGWAGADLRASLAAVAVPTLLVHGERDPVVPAAAATWAAGQIPGARLTLLPGAGHAPQLSRPREVVDAVRPFLRALGEG